MTVGTTSLSVAETKETAEKPAKVFVRLRPDERMTVRKTLSYIWQDARRKRYQMESPKINNLTILTGCLSINVVAMAIWRFSILFRQWGFKPASLVLYYFNIILFGFDASPVSWVGPGFVPVHLVGVALHGKFGKNCTVFGRNAIGGKGKGDTGGWYGGPVLGDNVTVGFGGNILCDGFIGDNVTVGAGAWCFKSIEPNCIMTGMPATVLRVKSADELRQEAKMRGEIS